MNETITERKYRVYAGIVKWAIVLGVLGLAMSGIAADLQEQTAADHGDELTDEEAEALEDAMRQSMLSVMDLLPAMLVVLVGTMLMSVLVRVA